MSLNKYDDQKSIRDYRYVIAEIKTNRGNKDYKWVFFFAEERGGDLGKESVRLDGSKAKKCGIVTRVCNYERFFGLAIGSGGVGL